MWPTHCSCQTRPTELFPFSMCCWRKNQEGFMLRIHAMSPSLALLSAAALEQGESLNLGAVQDDASLRLPAFLCAQKNPTDSAVPLGTRWNPIQEFKHLFFSFLSTLLELLIKRLDFPLLWKPFCKLLSPAENSFCSQQVAAARHLIIFACVFTMVSIFQNPFSTSLFPTKEEACTHLQRDVVLPTDVPEQHIWDQQHTITSGFLRALCRSQDTWKLCSKTRNSFMNSLSSPVPWPPKGRDMLFHLSSVHHMKCYKCS